MIKYITIPYSPNISNENNSQYFVYESIQCFSINETTYNDLYQLLFIDDDTSNLWYVTDKYGNIYDFNIEKGQSEYKIFLSIKDLVDNEYTFILMFDDETNPLYTEFSSFEDIITFEDAKASNIFLTEFETNLPYCCSFDEGIGTTINVEGIFPFHQIYDTPLNHLFFDGIVLNNKIIVDPQEDLNNVFFYVNEIIDEENVRYLQINIRKNEQNKYDIRQGIVDVLNEVELLSVQETLDQTNIEFYFRINNDYCNITVIKDGNPEIVFESEEEFGFNQFGILAEADVEVDTKFIFDSLQLYPTYLTQDSPTVLPYILYDIPETVSIENQNNFVTGQLPQEMRLFKAKNIYNYDFEHILGDDYLVDLQYKHYMITYSTSVTVFDLLRIDDDAFTKQLNYFYRQLTPQFINDKQYNNYNYLYNIFEKNILTFVNKYEQILNRYGDLFHPFDTDVYIKKTFYYYLFTIDVFSEFSAKIESNQQVYQFLSLEFFKSLQENYIQRGKVNNITKILNNSFKNLQQILQLYVIRFSENHGVKIDSFQKLQHQLDFYSYAKLDGLKTVFEKQKFYLYDLYEEYFEHIRNTIQMSYKSLFNITNETELKMVTKNIYDMYLQKQVYRSMIIVYDSYGMRTVNILEQLKQFLSYIKGEYLPANMEIIFLDLFQFDSDLTFEKSQQYDFTHFWFNSHTENFELIRNLHNSN